MSIVSASTQETSELLPAVVDNPSSIPVVSATSSISTELVVVKVGSGVGIAAAIWTGGGCGGNSNKRVMLAHHGRPFCHAKPGQ